MGRTLESDVLRIVGAQSGEIVGGALPVRRPPRRGDPLGILRVGILGTSAGYTYGGVTLGGGLYVGKIINTFRILSGSDTIDIQPGNLAYTTTEDITVPDAYIINPPETGTSFHTLAESPSIFIFAYDTGLVTATGGLRVVEALWILRPGTQCVPP